MSQLEKLVGDVQTAFAEFKSANEARLKAIESKGYAPADLEEKVAKMNTLLSEKEAEIAAIKTAMARTPNHQEGKQGATETEKKYSAAICNYMRGAGNEQELKQLHLQLKTEKKTLSSDSDQDGGFLISPEMSSEIITQVHETSPMRQYASIQTVGSSSLEILHDLDRASSGWVGETEIRSNTGTPNFRMEEIPVHEIYAQPAATQRFLDDASVNVESWLAGKVSEEFSLQENTAFVAGNGVKKPKGFLSYANGVGFGLVEQLETAGVGAIVGDDLIKLMYKLKTAHAPGANFFMKRETIQVIRLLKDDENRYLWAPGLDGSTASSVLGHGVVEFADMPVVGANALSIAFGDMKKAYQIVDRIGIRTLRDPFTAKPFVLFYTTKRVGGGIKNFEALKLLKIRA